jgi:tRNA-specific 2-thiouridylase
MNSKKEKILLLMSGGVDSSVSALLLREMYSVIGVTMKIPNSQAQTSAQNIAKRLGIFHITIESEKIFTEQVINKYVSSRMLGLTPNPCADCNRALKFGVIPRLAEEMLRLPSLRIATGHYASIINDMDYKYICRASDTAKDQSYFLCDLPFGIVQKLLFPIGKMKKHEVREIAREAKLESAEKLESMDTCFCVPDEFFNMCKRGNIIETNGKTIGEHKGITNYTIGQRKGLGIAAKEALYVLNIDTVKNTIIVGTKNEAFRKNVKAIKINNLTNKALDDMINKKLFGKTRSRGEPSPCKIIEISHESFTVEFEEPQFAPTPGQRLVCYNEIGAIMLSGVIDLPI